MFAGILLGALALSHTAPGGVPTGATIATWERMAGHAHTDGNAVAYELHVHPQRRALYTLTRFRVHVAGRQDPENEVLIWNAKPGSKEPLRCFERVQRPDWRTLGVGRRWTWQPVAHRTDRYDAAMRMAVQVYHLHQAVLRASVPHE